MSQLEYGDYYKFIASVGIALIAVAILLPWLFLHESFAEIRRQDTYPHDTPQRGAWGSSGDSIPIAANSTDRVRCGPSKLNRIGIV
jgi:hypothetical protein